MTRFLKIGMTETPLSTHEDTNISLSTAMYKGLPIIQLMKYLKVACDDINTSPEGYCELLEDNQSHVAVAKWVKYPVQINHIAIKHNYFRSLVDRKVIKFSYV